MADEANNPGWDHTYRVTVTFDLLSTEPISPEGLASYVEHVTDIIASEHYEGSLNSLGHDCDEGHPDYDIETDTTLPTVSVKEV